ncbi:MAG: T9SS type A sorting domain-containing protein [Bacteroidetes bacterium]|nr:T9SS type A sorting domain-containing protein [Bacteroidota bacterium]
MKKRTLETKKTLLYLKAKELGHLIHSRQLSKDQYQKLRAKLEQLIEEIKPYISIVQLKRILGSVALLFGLMSSGTAEAQNFKTGKLNPFGLEPIQDYIMAPTLADLDNDGDLDLLVSTYYGQFIYYKNSGTAKNPQYEKGRINPFGIKMIDTSYMVFSRFCDLDNDGDFDLITGDYYGDFRFYRNIGQKDNPSFEDPVVHPFGLSNVYEILSFSVVDIDGDGDLDIMAGTYDPFISFIENTGSATNPAFAAPVGGKFGLPSSSQDYLAMMDFADLDNDGDLDLLYLNENGNFFYQENYGSKTNPDFAIAVKDPFNLKVPTEGYYVIPVMVDIDDDGDLDIIGGATYYSNYYEYSAIIFYENTGSIGIEKLSTDKKISIYPNPATDVLHIRSISQFKLLEITNYSGQLVIKQDFPEPEINVSSLAPGIYLLKLEDTNGFIQTEKFVVN